MTIKTKCDKIGRKLIFYIIIYTRVRERVIARVCERVIARVCERVIAPSRGDIKKIKKSATINSGVRIGGKPCYLKKTKQQKAKRAWRARMGR